MQNLLEKTMRIFFLLFAILIGLSAFSIA